MNNSDDPPGSPHLPTPRFDPATSRGGYATGLVIIHTRDEFLLDFIAGFARPGCVVGRVITSPPHLKRMIVALLDNLGKYERAFGSVPSQPDNTRAQPGQVKDLYASLEVPEGCLGGAYANGMAVMHTRDEFVMDFQTNFPPAAKVGVRVIVSPAHLRRIISVLGDNLSQYEERFGKIDDGAPPAEPRALFNLN